MALLSDAVDEPLEAAGVAERTTAAGERELANQAKDGPSHTRSGVSAQRRSARFRLRGRGGGWCSHRSQLPPEIIYPARRSRVNVRDVQAWLNERESGRSRRADARGINSPATIVSELELNGQTAATLAFEQPEVGSPRSRSGRISTPPSNSSMPDLCLVARPCRTTTATPSQTHACNRLQSDRDDRCEDSRRHFPFVADPATRSPRPLRVVRDPERKPPDRLEPRQGCPSFVKPNATQGSSLAIAFC